MMDFFKYFIDVLTSLISPKEEPVSKYKISYIPKMGDKSINTGVIQMRLNDLMRAGLKEDNHFGALTKKAVSDFQRSKGLPGSGLIGPKTLEFLGIELDGAKPAAPSTGSSKNNTPWMTEVSKYDGKHESDPSFQAYMNPFWTKSGLNFKGLVGSARAWCALFVFMGLVVAGYNVPVNSFRAKAWDGHGHAIAWKQDGIPYGAFIRINSKGNCTTASGNHLTHASGDCTAQDLTKPNATFAAYGGNQGNKAKISVYKATTICYVGWPDSKKDGTKVAKPGRVTVSKDCTRSGDLNESTR